MTILWVAVRLESESTLIIAWDYSVEGEHRCRVKETSDQLCTLGSPSDITGVSQKPTTSEISNDVVVSEVRDPASGVLDQLLQSSFEWRVVWLAQAVAKAKTPKKPSRYIEAARYRSQVAVA